MKRQLSSPVKRSLAKSTTKTDCYDQLKSMLPRARHEEHTSEVRAARFQPTNAVLYAVEVKLYVQ